MSRWARGAIFWSAVAIFGFSLIVYAICVTPSAEDIARERAKCGEVGR